MPRRINRRDFLQVSAGTAVAGAALGALGAPVAKSRLNPEARKVLTKEFRLEPGDLTQGVHHGVTAAADGLQPLEVEGAGHYLSPVFASDIVFDYVGVFWSAADAEAGAARLWARTSGDGGSWGPWQEVLVEMSPGPGAEYEAYGSLISADRARHVQVMAELKGRAPIQRLGIVVLNPYDGPQLETADDSGPVAHAAETDLDFQADDSVIAAAGSKPIDFKREDWGADESLRFAGGEEIWPRTYVPTKKLVVHHTATGNGYATVSQAKAQVRAIYAYHAKTLGWGDIGYNCIIDKFGNSYEGRRGRNGPGYDGPGGRELLSEDVVGGHASGHNYGSSGISLLGTFSGVAPSPQMISRLIDVLAWECRRHGINPQSSSDFLRTDGSWNRNLRNVLGHRDVFSTGCPGDNVYSLLPYMRNQVASRLASSSPKVTFTSSPPEGTHGGCMAKYRWKGSGGSGGYRYSYFLEGWSLRDSGEVNHIRGFNSRKGPVWSPWSPDAGVDLPYVLRGLYTMHVRVRDSQGRVSVYHATRSFRGRKQGKVCNGALIKGSGPAVYVTRGGLRRRIPNPLTFEANGFLGANVNNVPNSLVSSVPEGQPLLNASADGNLFKGSGDPVYVMQGGRRRHITSRQLLQLHYGWDAVRVISNGRLNAIPQGPPLSGPPCPLLIPPAGALVKGSGAAIYQIRGGLKRHVPNSATFETNNFQLGNVNRLADSALASIPLGHPLLSALADGNLLKGTGDAVYVMQAGRKRHIASRQLLEAHYGWDAVQAIPDTRLNKIPNGSPLTGPPFPLLIPPGSRLVKGSGNAVYVMRAGLKRLIPNPITLEAYGYRWGNVDEIAESSLASIPVGEPLLDALADGNLLKGTADAVYVMEAAKRRHIMSRQVLESCYGWDAVYVVSDSQLNALPLGEPLLGEPCPRLSPPDGSLIKGDGDPVYIMHGGLRRHIASAASFTGCGYHWGNVNVIPESSLAAMPVGAQVTAESCV